MRLREQSLANLNWQLHVCSMQEGAFIMRPTFIILLVCSLSVCAHAETRTLALYLKHPERVSAESGQTMRSELKRLLDPAGIDVVWKDFADRKGGEDFDFVAVGSIEGLCTAGESDLSNGTGLRARMILADAAVAADRILPYFNVDCQHLIRTLGNGNNPATIGRALARLIGHELYHILARTCQHPNAGLAKAAFSLDDLTAPGMNFDVISLGRISRVSVAKRAKALRPGASHPHISS
jgi:hypothetical protein